MAKNKKFKETDITDYYDLKTDKVDELVAALRGEVPAGAEEVSMNISDCTGVDDPKNVTRRGVQRKFDPYKTDFLGRIPAWVKALFVKWWFAGMVCYFVMWGLSGMDSLDRAVILGAVIGLVVDVLVNPLFRFMETDRREYDAFMMFPFPFKAFWTFFANIIYYVLVIAFVMVCYAGLNELIIKISGAESVLGGVEPLLFGVITLAIDMAFIGIKDGVVGIVRKLRKKESVANV